MLFEFLHNFFDDEPKFKIPKYYLKFVTSFYQYLTLMYIGLTIWAANLPHLNFIQFY